MTERESLIELLKKGQAEHSERSLAEIQKLLYEKHRYNSATDKVGNLWDELADYLLAHGVIVPPCKVGDTVYYIKGGYYKDPKYCEVSRPCRVVEVSLKLQRNGEHVMRGFITDNGTRYNFDSIGKTVFLAREEAEKALERSRG